ncbi:MAG: AAA-like domain-containing protein, partial [Cyanobacteria bacterium P01_A01_bin.83]
TADAPVKLPTITAYKLESIGLVKLNKNLVAPSCELYRLYFRDRL